MHAVHFSSSQWAWVIVAAFCVGLTKSGISGLGLFPLVILAQILPARESTGYLLPMLLCGDFFAVAAYRKHAQWSHVIRLLPPALLGVVVGYLWMKHISEAAFKPLIGGLVLAMVVLQWARTRYPQFLAHLPHTRAYSWVMGMTAGTTTMLANAAGPIATIYMLTMELPKWEFMGTSAWFFLIVNLFKVPFSYDLGLINGGSLGVDLYVLPAIIIGVIIGRWIVHRMSQKVFDQLLLAFAALAALRLLWP